MYSGATNPGIERDQHMSGHASESCIELLRPGRQSRRLGPQLPHGDASATDIGGPRRANIGQLCRQVSAATQASSASAPHGTVAAASDWDGPVQDKDVRPPTRRATSASCTTRGCRPSRSTCAPPRAVRYATSWAGRGSSAPSASSTARRATREPLLPGGPRPPVRRAVLVRRDAGRHSPARRAPAGRRGARHLPVRTVSLPRGAHPGPSVSTGTGERAARPSRPRSPAAGAAARAAPACSSR